MEPTKKFTILKCHSLPGAATWTTYTIRQDSKTIHNVHEHEINASEYQNEAMEKWEKKHRPIKTGVEGKWAICDRLGCNKWRWCDASKLPIGKWTCDMTPDLRGNAGCHHDQEAWDEKAWAVDKDGVWCPVEQETTRDEFLKLKDCGVCKVCKRSKGKRRSNNTMCIIKKQVLEDCFSKDASVATPVPISIAASNDDKKESSTAQPILQDASVTSVTMTMLTTCPNEKEQTDDDDDAPIVVEVKKRKIAPASQLGNRLTSIEMKIFGESYKDMVWKQRIKKLEYELELDEDDSMTMAQRVSNIESVL